ncbi:GIY-YIG nuclease family protein [Delftia sp. Cs1-4]|uniref:GIY-YIG nuclease family protein n=1 Tax=Delftia sp. (strain Cs1-4) TaxID=742013 RepID=UPI000674CB62|nr:GIY-YIG nuclease family protein [Delftia sp. Cs1-4]
MNLPATQLYQLLAFHSLDPAAQQVTLMRHTAGDYPVQRYVGTRALTLYQSRQDHKHPVGSLVIGFFGHRPGHALLLGIWRVKEVMPAMQAIEAGRLQGSFDLHDERAGHWYHELDEIDVMSDLRLKLEIRWGEPAVSWRRVLRQENNYPIALSPVPPVPFRALSSTSLIMAELRLAMQDVAWQQALGNVCGIYLITDEFTGHQYVGSASGACGVWQRWRDYANTGHGDNLELSRRLHEAPGCDSEFRFTLLEALPLGIEKSEAEARENYWKVALGSRRFGMNRNGAMHGAAFLASDHNAVASHKQTSKGNT